MKIYVVILLFIFQKSFSQESAEQASFNYFFENLFEKEYSNVSKIQFSGFSESTFSGKIGDPDCLDEIELSNLSKWNFEEADGNTLVIDNYTKHINKKKNGNKLILQVYERIYVEETNFIVLIKLTKKDHFSDFYYFVVNKEMKIVKWCKLNYII
jgi:hypothetical protein